MLNKLKQTKAKPEKLSTIFTMPPQKMALKSKYVVNSYNYLLTAIDNMDNKILQKLLTKMLANEQQAFLSLYKDNPERRQETYEKLIECGYIDSTLTVEEFLPYTNNQPIWSAIGSHYYGHHSHPGGLVLHTAENLRISFAAAKAHSKMFNLKFDNDIVVFAQIAHDLAKAWLLAWLPDGACLPQYNIAQTGAHHIFGLAESIYLNSPPKAVFAQACTHVNPGNKKALEVICHFLKAACIIANVDPVKYGLFDQQGKLTFDYKQMEFWFCYMGDHSVVFTVPSARRVIKNLKILAQEDYGFTQEDLKTYKFNQFRNYVLTQNTITRLYKLLSKEDKTAFKRQIAKQIK